MKSCLRARFAMLLLLGCATTGISAAQNQSDSSHCASDTIHQIGHDSAWFGQGLESAPRSAFRVRNLEWELPIAATTAALIAWADAPASRHIHSQTLQNDARRASNIGIGLELGTAGVAYGVGCFEGKENLRQTGLLAVEAAGAASAMTWVVQRGVNRQRPFQDSGTGEFWEGGTSFASGHSAASFAFASVIANRYPRKAWVKWGAYAAAAAVSLARYPAKQHFLSDILVGSTIGYVTGTYLSSPHIGIQQTE